MAASPDHASGDDGAALTVEGTIWSGSPSQIVNLKSYLIGGAILAALIAGWIALVWNEVVPNRTHWLFLVPIAAVVLWLGWIWLRTRTTRYELTNQRLRLREGILAKTTDDLELYRVKDWTLHEPLLYRIFNLGTLHIITSDQTTPELTLPALPNAHEVREQLRTSVEFMRQHRKVREIDFE